MGNIIPSALGYLHSPRAGHETAALVCPFEGLLYLPPTFSAGTLEVRPSFYGVGKHWNSAISHSERKSRKGEVVFLSSTHHPVPLGLQRGGARERFLLPAGPAGLAHGGTEPGSVGADCWYNCTHMAIANQGAGFLPARTCTAIAVGAVPGDARAGCGASGTPVHCNSLSRGGTQTGWFHVWPLTGPGDVSVTCSLFFAPL